ncbi:histidine transport system permease protein [Silvimonas terrae]|uniref:Histidine/lysine/arginine/ornithine transport system permease protein HisM n=1 Tax=Silvimonas terrae TaxID=300266 RepID=A0A840R7T6_9NEIS|nr:ABC transporter permease [Silvimonas terrae]MBB5189335.1 histidine transport system permease protein [Silvimonas terrae]
MTVIETLQTYWQAYLYNDGSQMSGLAMTLWLLVLSLAIGFAMALVLATARVSQYKALSIPVRLYSYVFRGTPLYVQLLLIYSGIYGITFVQKTELLGMFFCNGFNCAVLAFALNTCAYTTEIFVGAIRNIPYGEVEAARAFGMSWFTLYRRIILPSALRRALPMYSNEVILMLHATSIAFAATVPDLLKVARDVNAATYQPFTAFGIAAVLYLVVSFVLVYLFRIAERKWLAFQAPAGR